MFFIRGASSLFFIISTIKAFYCSKLIFWKLSNFFLIGASFLCNATQYSTTYLVVDYIAIYLVSTSYINNCYINVPYSLLLTYEYNKYNSIENVKDAAFLTAMGKSIIYTYLYVDKTHFYIIMSSSIAGVIIYKIRCALHEKNNKKYTLLLTYLFHFCVMSVLYVSSNTAV